MTNKVKTFTTLGLCTIECLIFGGTIFGWPSLAYVYKDLRFFSCEKNQTLQPLNGTQPCPEQGLYLPLALTVGFVALGVTALPIGLLFDRFGLRLVRGIALVAGITGSLVLAFTTKAYPFLIFVGTFFTGGAGIIIIITSNHVALLAGVRAPIFNLIFCGVRNASGVIYFLIKLGYDHGFSHRWSLIILACSWGLVIVTTFFLLPPFKVLEENNSEKEPSSTKKTIAPKESVWYFVKGFPYIIHILYFNIIHVWSGLVIGIMNSWLSAIYNRDQVLVSNATNLYAYTQFGFGLIISPFAGAFIDWVRLCVIRNMPENSSATQRVVVTAPSLLLACVSYTLVAVFILLPLSASPYLVFVFTEVGRAFFYGTTVAYLMIIFPLEYFGVLYGLMLFMTAVSLPVQYGYLRWVEASGYMPMVSFLLGTLVLSFTHPVIIIINYIRSRRNIIIPQTQHNKKF